MHQLAEASYWTHLVRRIVGRGAALFIGLLRVYSAHPGNTAGSRPVSPPPLDFLP